MQKKLIALAILLLGSGIYAQEGFKLGFHGGLPIDDFNDAVTLTLGLDLGYMYAVNETIDVGIATGFIHGFAESFSSEALAADYPDMQFMPLAAAVRIWTSNSFSFGVEGGYAVGINADNDGGLYYRPIIGYLMGPSTEVNFSYATVALDGATWNTLNLGVLYTFKSKRSR
ncbi:hypothetical protein [Maribacter polysaccharolyticus]|uniref:hypothetical protein n=1 Tax=Maribacter polysaccharolyticus TaxID=3020831 RepID=UPI00237F1F89|nr:hypothetical protein [Maribacter polysaccharolyticus]MDE3741300.1 hypothetical protein [Maribacter polysaccharolyticus]